MHFDLVDLQLFVNIADCDSLTRGAERTAMSLPAASVRIKNLEEQLGGRLLHRSNHGVTLTQPGQALAHHARLVLAQLQQLRGDLQEYAQGIKGHLRVFANTTAITEFLPAVLRSYLLSHPDVNVDLRERSSGDIVSAVSSGKTDIGIVSGEVRTEGLEVIPYRRDRLVLAVPVGHALASQKSLFFADTLTCDHIGLHESSAIHSFLNRIAADMNRTLKPRIQVSNFEAACRMVEAKVGVAILPASAARRYCETMDICIVNLKDEWALRRLHICVRSMDLLPTFARDLIKLLREDADAGRTDPPPPSEPLEASR